MKYYRQAGRMMSRYSILLIYFFLVFMIIGSVCSLAQEISGTLKQPTRPATSGVSIAGQSQGPAVLPTLGAQPVGTVPASLAAAPGEATTAPHQPPPRRPPARLISNTIVGLVSELVDVFTNLTATPARPRRRAVLPSLTPTPTRTNTPVPPAMPTPTQTLLPTTTPPPTPTLLPPATPTPTQILLPTATSLPTQPLLPMPVLLPTATPLPTFTPVPAYDFLLAEFYNSPTTNSFLLIYVAIVDPNEIPIGDMKIVGIRLDHQLTYESPLSKWHYEGYSAPGEVIKTGNVKFEPPGGIETTSWVLHLEDAQGNRQSVDIPFDVDVNNKQWYFIKLRRTY